MRTDRTLAEVRRILRPGGTFYCAVNFYEESEHSHEWRDRIPVDTTLWSMAEPPVGDGNRAAVAALGRWALSH